MNPKLGKTKADRMAIYRAKQAKQTKKSQNQPEKKSSEKLPLAPVTHKELRSIFHL